MEAVRLRVKDIDFCRDEITVRDGKGEKDRVTRLPRAVKPRLKLQIGAVQRLHKTDLRPGYGAVHLPYALERKYQNAATDFAWQYVFPAKTLSTDPRSGTFRRHHVSEQNVQRAVKAAVRVAGITKHGTCHTFRHSFATNLLKADYDIHPVR